VIPVVTVNSQYRQWPFSSCPDDFAGF
jgi:hypothetical protein